MKSIYKRAEIRKGKNKRIMAPNEIEDRKNCLATRKEAFILFYLVKVNPPFP